jgi:1-acyl-sn-glycerol-3-phosphate acyltransferase
MNRTNASALPRIARGQLAWFARYASWYLKRNFHALHLLRRADLGKLNGMPLLICLNHPSWWDPLVALYLSQRFFPERYHVAPIAVEGLAKYKFFERLGFFGIEPRTPRGAARFLVVGEAVMGRADGAFWITAQGEFTDVRRPVVLARGIGRLAHRCSRFAMLPVALEYMFWNERYPEAFACLGEIVFGSGSERSSEDWTELFTQSLQTTANALSERVQQRRSAAFEPLIQGNAGVGGVYDLWRAAKARLQGKRWQPEHGEH